MMRSPVRLLALFVSGALLLQSSTAAATTTRVASSASQHAIVVQLGAQHLDVHACAALSNCDPRAGTRIAIPNDAKKARVDVIQLSRDRRALLISAPASQGAARWVAVVAASTRPSGPSVHKLLRGWLGRDQLLASGAKRQRRLLRERSKDHERLVLASQYQDADVCGRATGFAARELDPKTLSWTRSYTRSLSAAEKKEAVRLFAKRKSAPIDGNALGSLHARLASSSLRGSSPQAITDGKLDVAWREAARGAGQGEFVVLSAPKEVPITGFEFALHPPALQGGKPNQQDAAPRHVWLATASTVYSITLPEDAQQQPEGASYRVDLAEPIHTDCVGLVLDDAYEPQDKDAVVAIGELRALTPFDQLAHAQIVQRLDSPDGEAIRAILLRSRGAILGAVARGYDQLNTRGRDRALDIIESAPCSRAANFFVKHALSTTDQGDTRRRLERGMKRCQAMAVPQLLRAFSDETKMQQRLRAALALAALAPEQAFQPVAKALTNADAKTRRGLRSSLNLSAQHRRARAAIDRWLGSKRFASLSLVAQIDVLRAIERWLPKLRHGKQAFASVQGRDDSFRTRYLLLPPASTLAAGGDARALTFIRESLADRSQAPLRVQAAGAAAPLPALRDDLVRRASDSHPRVRAASLTALSESDAPLGASVVDAVGRTLQQDPWTFVRTSAAALLGAQPRTPASDEALVSALEDKRRVVRIASLNAMGARKSHIAAQDIHDVADDPRQHPSVRLAALDALASMCRKDAAPLLYKMALRAGPATFPTDRELGLAALRALGHIRPHDLSSRLAPLLEPETPRAVRTLAKRTLASKGGCTTDPIARLPDRARQIGQSHGPLEAETTSAPAGPLALSGVRGRTQLASRAATRRLTR